jgi:hypothetical protein
MARQINSGKDFVGGGGTLASCERSNCERVGPVGGCHRAMHTLRFVATDMGGLETQEGHKRMFLLPPLSPFWPVVGGYGASRLELWSL